MPTSIAGLGAGRDLPTTNVSKLMMHRKPSFGLGGHDLGSSSIQKAEMDPLDNLDQVPGATAAVARIIVRQV